MRCAPSYRHNDITGLIIGKPNTIFEILNGALFHAPSKGQHMLSTSLRPPLRLEVYSTGGCVRHRNRGLHRNSSSPVADSRKILPN